jgi:hypothetical protein
VATVTELYPYPVIRHRCTGVIEGREQSIIVDLKREVWDTATPQWRDEYLDSVRDRFTSWLRAEFGIELPDERRAALTVIVEPPNPERLDHATMTESPEEALARWAENG